MNTTTLLTQKIGQSRPSNDARFPVTDGFSGSNQRTPLPDARSEASNALSVTRTITSFLSAT